MIVNLHFLELIVKCTLENLRHIGLRHSYVRQMIIDSVITMDYVKSSQNLADRFTKSLAREMVPKISLGMGLKPIKNNHS